MIERTLEAVVETLRYGKESDTKCSLLIGAGCSVSAGIPPASGFADEIENTFHSAVQSIENKDYASYMGRLSQGKRKQLIREYIRNATPNWAHLAIAQLMQSGYVDQVVTTNFDPLVTRACALCQFYPSVYDLTALKKEFDSQSVYGQSVIYLHGQYSGLILVNTEKEIRTQRTYLRNVFEDAPHRIWIVVGYSGATGANDPVLHCLSVFKEFEQDLYWVGYLEKEPVPSVKEKLLVDGKSAYLVRGYDADTFFVRLASRLGCFPPEYVAKPFSFLDHLLESLERLPKRESEDPILDFPGEEDLLVLTTRTLRSLMSRAIHDFENRPTIKEARHLSALTKFMTHEFMEGLRDLDVTWEKAKKALIEGHSTGRENGKRLLEEADAEFYLASQGESANDQSLWHLWGFCLQIRASREPLQERKELYEAAHDKYSKALGIDRESSSALVHSAYVLSMLALIDEDNAENLFQEAKERAKEAVNKFSEQPDIRYYYGVVLLNHYLRAPEEDKPTLLSEAKDKFLEAKDLRLASGAMGLAFVAALEGRHSDCRNWLGKSRVNKDYVREELIHSPYLKLVQKEKWFQGFLAQMN